MSNVTLEEVVEEAKALPPEEQQQFGKLLENFGHLLFLVGVWSVLEMMRTLGPDEMQTVRQALIQSAHQALINKHRRLPESERRTLSRRIRGKYAHIRTSSDQFAQLKQEEIILEDCRR